MPYDADDYEFAGMDTLVRAVDDRMRVMTPVVPMGRCWGCGRYRLLNHRNAMGVKYCSEACCVRSSGRWTL